MLGGQMAASFRQQSIQASCQPPTQPPTHTLESVVEAGTGAQGRRSQNPPQLEVLTKLRGVF